MPKIFLYLSSLIGIFLIFITIFSFVFRKNNNSQLQTNNQEEKKETKQEEIEKKEEINNQEEIKELEKNEIEEESTFLKVIFIISVLIEVILFFFVISLIKNSCSLSDKKKIILNLFSIIDGILSDFFLFSVRKEKTVMIILFAIKILILCTYIMAFTREEE